jgi:hypothetical protein
MTRRTEVTLWSVAVLAGLVAVLGWRDTEQLAPEGLSPIAPLSAPPGRLTSDSLVALAALIESGDPFRLDRHPAAVAYRADLDGGAPQPAPLRPALVLKGVLGGPPWEAILEGLPGREGSVLVTAGQRFGPLRVQSVRPDTVIVKGTDTTWVLTVRRVWQ